MMCIGTFSIYFSFRKFALLLVRYAQNPIGLIHQLTIPIESEIDGEDVVSSGGNDKELESVRIQLYVTDTSWADDQLDDSALLFHVMIKTMPGTTVHKRRKHMHGAERALPPPPTVIVKGRARASSL